MQDTKECYLCRVLLGYGADLSCSNLEEHHCIFGTANRKLSEKYGLKVWLCREHHRGSKTSVHMDKTLDLFFRRRAQEAFEKEHSRDEFIKVFGKNYLEYTEE